MDTFLQRILHCLGGSEDINEVEVSPDGGWRPANADGPWYSVDQEYKPPARLLPAVKQEAAAAADG